MNNARCALVNLRFRKINYVHVGTRFSSTVGVIHQPAKVEHVEEASRPVSLNAKPFSEVPEVKGLPLIGSLLDYTKLRGFDSRYIYKLWTKRHEIYGDIFKEYLPSKGYYVFCRSREDTEIMFRTDGGTPGRDPLWAMSYVKEVASLPESFANLNGEKWYNYRRILNPTLLKHSTVWKYTTDQQDVASDLVKFIRRNLDDNKEVPNFGEVLTRWSFEIAGTFILSTRLGLLKKVPDPKMVEFALSQETILRFLSKSIGQAETWKYFNTKEKQELAKAVNISCRRVAAIIDENGSAEETMIGKILQDERLTKDEALSFLCDIIGASIETTSNASALVLYCLAANPEKQEKLRAEILSLPQNEKISGRVLNSLKYLNAFIKESTRLFPFAFALTRIYEEDIVLSGYRIPAGIQVLNTSNSTQNTNPEYFDEPQKFLPERWLNEKSSDSKFKLTGPFSFGMRACPGRMFAMQEIRLLLFEILKEFKVEYHHAPIVSVFHTTGAPSENPQFKFVDL